MDARFLFHLLQSECLERLNASSTVPSLPREKLANMLVFVPPLAYQREAARVLDGMLMEIGNTEEALQRIAGAGICAKEAQRRFCCRCNGMMVSFLRYFINVPLLFL